MSFRNLLIIVAIFGLGWGASFGAGMAVGRRGAVAQAAAPGNQTVPAAAGAASTGPAGAAGAQGGGQAGAGAAARGGQAGQGGQGAQAGPGGAVVLGGPIGVVDRLEGNTLVMSGANSQVMRVALTDQTQVLKQASASRAEITNGARVAVQPQGQPQADGTITAATVSILPEGTAGGAPGGPGAAAGQQRPGAAGAPGGTGQAPATR